MRVEDFLANLPPNAPLRTFIGSPAIAEQLLAFDKADATAIRKQTHHLRLGRQILWGTFLSAVIAALGLMPLEAPLAGRPSQLLTVLQATCFTLTFLAGVWITWSRPVNVWKRARAKAEAIRAEVFHRIMHSGAGELGGLQQRFACFMRAHIDSQIAYLKRRGEQHRRSASGSSPLRIAGYGLWTIAALIALAAGVKVCGELGIHVWPPLVTAAQYLLVPESGRWQLGISTVASSILTFASAQSLLNESDRNAWSFAATLDRIEQIIRRDLANAERAVQAGDEATVLAFSADLQANLSGEHLAWAYAYAPVDATSKA
jgi:hypothetical protein